jgi:hypothetical protein
MSADEDNPPEQVDAMAQSETKRRKFGRGVHQSFDCGEEIAVPWGQRTRGTKGDVPDDTQGAAECRERQTKPGAENEETQFHGGHARRRHGNPNLIRRRGLRPMWQLQGGDSAVPEAFSQGPGPFGHGRWGPHFVGAFGVPPSYGHHGHGFRSAHWFPPQACDEANLHERS